MKLLLDTHALLWFIGADTALPVSARMKLEDPDNIVAVSVASLWEMAIKSSLGRLELPEPFDVFIEEELATNQFHLLDIRVRHLSVLRSLPFHHRDPFDRLLVAQALADDYTLVSCDSAFIAYSVPVSW